ncbi:MAG: hypothetical protein CVV30_00035 [Methanomicrobiales archaeon HGW-Methanomicrobiales-1]|jgi:PAS domain S-box-containing protein|nr:MAG: hypothetical protein CVV30_00035 [Methanomicrobiales archaeon HGW-Methanomicrobiales-1]
MKPLDLFWTELQPHLKRLPAEEQEKLNAAFGRAGKEHSLLESKYHRAIRDRAAVHSLLKKSSEDLIQRYQTIFENSGTAMAVIEHDGTISLVNTLFLHLLGYRREDVENRMNAFALFEKSFQDLVRDYHQRRRTGDTTVPHRYEARVVNSEGKTMEVIIMIGLFPGTSQSVASIIDISDRKRMEDELGLFKASADHAYDEVFWLDFDGNMLYVNDAATRNTGYSREELLAMKIFKLDPDFDPAVWQGFVSNLRKEKTQLFTTRHRCKSGEIMDVEIVANYVTKDGSEYSFAFVRDITERKRMTDELRLFKASVDHANDEIFWFNFEAQILYVNDAASRVTGYSQEELLSMKVYELNPVVNPDMWAEFMATLRKGESLRFETRHRRKNGEIMDVEIVATYVTEDTSEYSIAFVRDITERKRTEAELAASKEYLARIFSSIKSGILVIDAETHTIVSVNTAAAGMIGLDEEEIVGKVCQQYICPTQCGKCPITDLHLTVDNAERMLITADGRQIPIIKDVIPVTLNGRLCLVETFIDNTERKRAEQEILHKNNELTTTYEQLAAVEEELREQFDKLAASQKLLQESEEKFHSVFNNANDAIFMHLIGPYGPGMFVEVNDFMCRSLGYTREELLTMTVKDVLSAANQKNVPDIGQALKERGETTFYTEVRRKDGTVFPAEVNSRTYHLGGKTVILAVARDITERTRAEQALLHKNDELEAAYEQMTAVEQELRINFENLTETEKKLRESEAWSREFAELLPQFVYEIDTSGRLTFVNQFATDVFGITRPMLDAGLNMRDIIIPEEWDQVQRNLGQILAGKKTTLDIYHLRKKDGSLMPTNISTAPVYRDGALRGFRGIVVDITESLNTQEALLKSESRFRELAELLPQIVFELDENLKFTFFNWNTIEMTGFAYDDLSQKKTGITDIILESDRQSAQSFFAHILKDSTSGQLPCSIVSLDGKEIPVTIYATPIIGENRVAGVRGVIVDIAEQKNLELALRESELRFRELAELIPQLIFETDRNFRFTYFNLAGMALTGYSNEDLSKGLDVFSLVDIAERGPFRESCVKILMGENVPPIQFSLVTSEKEMVPVIMYASHIFRGNEYAGIRGIIVDIADQKRLEKALATLNQKLNMMNSVTRHDVLNNITGLLGLVDMLGEITTDSNAQVLISEVRNLIMAIKDQIIFTKDYQSLGVKAPQWQSLCHDIRYAATTIGRENVQVTLPESDAEIYADPFFGRVFYNLIDNSNRHGGSVRFISIETEIMPDKSLIIRYRDDGIGVPPDEKDLIFEQGYGKNTGFGLFIIREILGITGLSIRETGTFRSGVLFEITVPKESWRPAKVNECGD